MADFLPDNMGTDYKLLLKKIRALQAKVKCLECCDGGIGVTDGAPTDPPTGNDPTILIDAEGGNIYYWDGDNWIAVPIGGGGDIYFEVTYSEAETLIAGDELVPGALYKITDRGDRGITLTALSENQFSLEGERIMLIPVTYEPEADVTYNETTFTSRGLFNPWHLTNAGYFENEFVIYNAHFWRCTSPFGVFGGISSAGDLQSVLDPFYWVRIEKTDPLAADLYREKVFKVKYDFSNDWISEQTDNHNNTVGISYGSFILYTGVLTVNPIEYTDWGLPDYLDTIGFAAVSGNKLPLGFSNNSAYADNINNCFIQNNDCACVIHNFTGQNSFAISNNLSTGARLGTNAVGGILHNVYEDGDFYITRNVFSGGIYENVGAEKIENNTVPAIYSNTCPSVERNKNTGDINNNAGGVVTDNANVGAISNNTTDDGVRNNRNSGDISGNNMPDGAILRNSNIGQIVGNTCISIDRNSNTGNINNNSHDGDIISNMNNGAILDCVGAGGFSVFNNINNGDINNPAGLAAADITDAIVNK